MCVCALSTYSLKCNKHTKLSIKLEQSTNFRFVRLSPQILFEDANNIVYKVELH